MIVSREISEKLCLYVGLLKKWHLKINLISEKTFVQVWERHIWDSAQAYSLVSSSASLVDVGSGAGFPGLVLSIMGLPNVFLVEPDRKKIIFLQEAIRLTHASAILYPCRVEQLFNKKFDVITSRAFSSIEKFLNVTSHIRLSDSRVLCFKGSSFQKDVDEAFKKWHFNLEIYSNFIQQKGRLLVLSEIQKKP